ncbi:hypothetical protein [Pikeienuella sp. HZG-20]|uniref:hypothetical protein n=1 Tax=Paludibacillus litoralis TaxID=3133267 RepID=UPI0030ED21F4
MTAAEIERGAELLAAHGPAFKAPPDAEGVARIGCAAPGCGCEFSVRFAVYAALPAAEIGCPKCSVRALAARRARGGRR